MTTRTTLTVVTREIMDLLLSLSPCTLVSRFGSPAGNVGISQKVIPLEKLEKVWTCDFAFNFKDVSRLFV